jgi:hypothetical protein
MHSAYGRAFVFVCNIIRNLLIKQNRMFGACIKHRGNDMHVEYY